MEGSLRNCLFTASMYFGFSVKHIVATLFIQTIFSLHKLHQEVMKLCFLSFTENIGTEARQVLPNEPYECNARPLMKQ